MWFVIVPLALLAAALLAIAFVPVDLAFSCECPREPSPRVRVRWLFGHVRLDRGGTPGRPRKDSGQPQGAGRKAKRDGSRRSMAGARRGTRIARGLVRVDGLARELGLLVGRLIQSIRLRRLEGMFRLGLSDPSETGEICGLMGPLSLLLPKRRHVDFRFEPDFAGPAFEIQARADLRVIPADVMGALLRCILSRPVLRGIWVVAWDSRSETS